MYFEIIISQSAAYFPEEIQTLFTIVCYVFVACHSPHKDSDISSKYDSSEHRKPEINHRMQGFG